MKSPILFPVVILIAWSMFMLLWTGQARIRAIISSKMKLNRFTSHQDQMNSLPPKVRWKADNYNNLMEQPTLFYAIALVLAFLGEGSGANLILAWFYVGLRVLHSLIHATVNKITLRFGLFFISSLVLIALIIKTLILFL